MIVKFLAAVSGLAAILAPLLSIFRSSMRAKGRTIGSGSAHTAPDNLPHRAI